MAKNSEIAAELSVVFAARGGLDNCRKTIESLLAQTIAPHIELIVTSDNADLVREIEEFVLSSGCFSRCQFLLQAGEDLASDRRIAATQAIAAVVAFAEDHSFPERNWAEELVAAFASSEHILAAAPLLLNPNPASAVKPLADRTVPALPRGCGSQSASHRAPPVGQVFLASDLLDLFSGFSPRLGARDGRGRWHMLRHGKQQTLLRDFRIQ